MSAKQIALLSLAGALGLAAPIPARAAPPAPITAAALDHVSLYVRDPDASAAFYTSLFGLKQIPAPVPNARWLVMGAGVTLHIIGGRTTPLAHTKWDHMAVACADMDLMIQSLKAKAVPWTDIEGRNTPQVRPDGVKQIFVQDPDGYWIEINDALKAR